MSERSRIVVRRVLSSTPLARGYEAALSGGGRPRRAIPWDRFEPSRYAPGARQLAADAHRRLAEGEYYAVGLFGRIASGISMAAAPLDIVAAATRVSSDEIRHADHCTRFATLCAGEEVTLEIERSALAAAAPVLPGVDEVDFLVAKYAATGETLAAALLNACRTRAKDPVARALFSALLRDEVQHGRLGWYYLAWRAPQWTRAQRQVIADRLGEFVADIEHALFWGRDATPSDRASADALGVLDTEAQRAVVRAIMEDEIVPGLDALGLGASHAWAARRRGAGGEPPRSPSDFVFGGPTADAGGRPDPAAPPPARPGAPAATRAVSDPPRAGTATEVVDRAAAWLAAQVEADGSVCSAMNGRTRRREPTGAMHHGRTAVVVRALQEHGGHAAAALRARVRLGEDVAAALAGAPVPGWVPDLPLVAGTLALCSLAGVDVRGELLGRAGDPALQRTPWYGAQVVAALGEHAPGPLWAACVASLDAEPWSPWVGVAARARGDRDVLARVDALLAAAVGLDGAVVGPYGAEVARTAATVEALAPFRSEATRDAARRACAFLRREQLAELGEPDHPDTIDGAFPAFHGSDLLRPDVTAHAVLAMLAWLRAR